MLSFQIWMSAKRSLAWTVSSRPDTLPSTVSPCHVEFVVLVHFVIIVDGDGYCLIAIKATATCVLVCL